MLWPIRWVVYDVANVMSNAMPSPPPAWREVLTRPDARPAWAGWTEWVAAMVDATTDSPIPIVASMPGSTTYPSELPVGPILASSSSPLAIMTRPEVSVARRPKSPTSLPACRAVSMMASAMGKNARPAFSGESPSTSWRYSELTNHIGNTAALNRNTIRFASESCLVIALNGMSGAFAQRASMTMNRASSATAMISGT